MLAIRGGPPAITSVSEELFHWPIVCPSMTYWASAAPAQMLGAAVHFADIDPTTLCLAPGDIEHRIGPRTKAIIAVHYAGHPCEMDAILAVARRHGVKVIEDVSHAHGSRYRGRMCGTLGDIAAMSMMAGKSFAIGEAGMIVTSDRLLFERCVAFGHYERTGTPSRFNPADASITEESLLTYRGLPLGGVKHRMNQTCSAMGRVQLKHYPARIAEIQRAMNRFWDLLDEPEQIARFADAYRKVAGHADKLTDHRARSSTASAGKE